MRKNEQRQVVASKEFPDDTTVSHIGFEILKLHSSKTHGESFPDIRIRILVCFSAIHRRVILSAQTLYSTSVFFLVEHNVSNIE